VSASASVSASALVSVSAPALQTPVYLTAAALAQESVVVWAEGVEQAQVGEAAPRQHRVLRAEAHHLCQLRTTRYPARPSAPEISNSIQTMPLQCSELQTREETKERACLFDMEFYQPQCRARVRGLLLCFGRIKGFPVHSVRDPAWADRQ
jgi:hypothetical protein